MRWALVAHPDQFIRGRLVQTPKPIPEDAAAVAQSQGWIVLITDTDCFDTPLTVDNAQSNPRRVAEPGED